MHSEKVTRVSPEYFPCAISRSRSRQRAALALLAIAMSGFALWALTLRLPHAMHAHRAPRPDEARDGEDRAPAQLQCAQGRVSWAVWSARQHKPVAAAPLPLPGADTSAD